MCDKPSLLPTPALGMWWSRWKDEEYGECIEYKKCSVQSDFSVSSPRYQTIQRLTQSEKKDSVSDDTDMLNKRENITCLGRFIELPQGKINDTLKNDVTRNGYGCAESLPQLPSSFSLNPNSLALSLSYTYSLINKLILNISHIFQCFWSVNQYILCATNRKKNKKTRNIMRE